MNTDSFGRQYPIRRRPTPIPVAPPRVPTPMPPINNNNFPGSNSKEQDHQSTKSHHHPSSVGGDLISKPSYKQQAQALDNDVKTAWINPRIISKVESESIKKPDYNIPPSSERNMNGYYHSHAYQQHYQQPSYQKQQSCGRIHDKVRLQQHEKEWETAVNGRAKQRSQVPVPASTSVAAEAKRKNRPVTGKVTRFQMEPPHEARGSLNRPSNAARTKSKLPSSHYQRVQRTLNPVIQQERVKGFVGYHHQSATTACYVSGMPGNSLHASDSVYGVYAETKYIYAVNRLAGNQAESSAAAAFFAR